MFKKMIRMIFTVIGLILGYTVADKIIKIPQIAKLLYLNSTISQVIFMIVMCIVFGIITFLIYPIIYKYLSTLIEYFEKSMQKFSIVEIIYGVFGAIISLILMTIIVRPINDIGTVIGPIIVILLNLVAAVVGAEIMVKKKEDISNFLINLKKPSFKDKKNKEQKNNIDIPKILDTSVIIDGRIFDICKTGFIEGPLVISNAVLDELRHISDSSDALKRNRGRRGLDILNKIQKELPIKTIIIEDTLTNIAEVDSKLLKLAQELDGKVITNDYNLNKVAEFQGVPVLNINELSNAVKTAVLPGEEMSIDIVKDGKEASQGVAYLDDGTMIVVENGRKFIGKNKTVVVTSVLQTAAGRMIFARPKE